MASFLQVRVQSCVLAKATMAQLKNLCLTALSTSAGGAISNMYSVMIARYKFYPEVKTKGMAVAPRLILFTSEHVSLSLCHHDLFFFIFWSERFLSCHKVASTSGVSCFINDFTLNGAIEKDLTLTV